MAHGTCSIEGCDKPLSCRGWCVGHYDSWRRRGDPLSPPGTSKKRGSTAARFWAKVERRGADECWPWTAALSQGYGRIYAGNVDVPAHRWSYEQAHGPIPDGLTLDHLCHTRDPGCEEGPGCPHRACVNPNHLEPVTRAENVMRGRSLPAQNRLKTHCKRGHELTAANTYVVPGGGRQCRACNRLRKARRTRTAVAQRTADGDAEIVASRSLHPSQTQATQGKGE